MKKSRLIELVREIINEELELESQASDDAKRQGLEYYGFGRYGKNNVVTHTSKGGKLTPVPQAQQKATKQGDWEDWGGGLAYHPGVGSKTSKKDDDWEDWGGGLAYHPAKAPKAEPTPSADDEKGDMEIDGMYFNKQKVKAANPKLWKQYDAARKIAGGDVYMKGGKFYKQKSPFERDKPEPVD